MKEYPTVEVYIMDVSKREMVEINFGGRIESLSREKAMGLADAIIHALVTDEQSYQEAMGLEERLTSRAPDEGYCAHDWSFPPEFCPVCNKRVPLIRLRG